MVIVNDRCGLAGDDTTLEYAPSIEPQGRYFEATLGLGTSFGYNANETSADLLMGDEAIALLVDVVAKGGNLLLNVGPRADGAIPQIRQERLVALGDWLEVNGEAIYGTRPVDPGLEDDVRATRGDDATYLLLLSWPDDGVLEDASCDGALSTFTLCTIPGVEEALAEVRRVLRPGGRFHFLEHGLSPDASVATWQRRLEPLQKRLADGCHLTRDPNELVRAAGFEIERSESRYATGPRPWTWMSEGAAVKPR